MDKRCCTNADVFLFCFLGTMNVTMKPHITGVGMDTCYSCKSKDMIQSDSVNQTLWNVLIQAFVSNGSKSENSECRLNFMSHPGSNNYLLSLLTTSSLCFSFCTVTTCSADLPVTPTTPTTTTTAAPNSTTIAPHNTTTIPTTIPTTTPTPTLPPPVTGKYSIKQDENSTACLLASFGLRIGFKQGDVCSETQLIPLFYTQVIFVAVSYLVPFISICFRNIRR